MSTELREQVYSPAHREAAAHALGFESAAQRDRILTPASKPARQQAGIEIRDDLAHVTFAAPFDLTSHALFLKCKTLPESQLSYTWQTDTYELTTPARFASLLGLPDAPPEADGLELAAHLFDYQRYVVERALEARRMAVWLECGLGKTLIMLEWARHVVHRTHGRVLIICPLQVIAQHREEARRFYAGDLELEHLQSRAALIDWCTQPGPGVGITNYAKFVDEPIGELRLLAGLCADESSILSHSGGGITKWNLIKSSKGIPYKLSCTATPAPNETMEYASQASFLEKLRTEGEVIWTYFQKTKTGDWIVKPHAREQFYRFLASWSIYMRHVGRFGFEDPLASVPAPVIHEHRLDITPEQQALRWELIAGKGSLFSDDRLGIQERTRLAQVARGFLYHGGSSGKRTIQHIPSAKPQACADIVRAEMAAGRQVLVWTVFDEESVILSDLLRDHAEVIGTLHGGQTESQRADLIERFRKGDLEVLISKPVLLGFGLNFQNCRAMVFSGISDSFEQVYQSIRRAYRFGQTEPVQVHFPYVPELEGMVLSNIKRKEAQFEADVEQMETSYAIALGELGLLR